MRSETAISLALFALYRRQGEPEIGYRSDVLDVIRELSEHRLSLGGIRFRVTPRGLQSDEVAEFVGRLAMGGYLVQESPIRLTNHGIELLHEHLTERMTEGDEEVTRAVSVLEQRGTLGLRATEPAGR